jgi:hypothetical protein
MVWLYSGGKHTLLPPFLPLNKLESTAFCAQFNGRFKFFSIDNVRLAIRLGASWYGCVLGERTPYCPPFFQSANWNLLQSELNAMCPLSFVYIDNVRLAIRLGALWYGCVSGKIHFIVCISLRRLSKENPIHIPEQG